MGLAAAIVGLTLLVLLHEAGHFFAARAVGMTPRKFYLGFGPPLVKKKRGLVEYGIGCLPLGGYVKIPGMNRPSPGDLAAGLVPEARARYHDELKRLDDALAAGNEIEAKAALASLPDDVRASRTAQELAWSLEPDAYWRQTTWRRLVAIGAGPGVNLVFALVLFTALFLVATTRDTNVVGATLKGEPARAAGLRAGDHVIKIAGTPVRPKNIPDAIQATGGKPFRVTVIRDGKRLVLGPLSARPIDGRYRIGIAIEQRTGAGESLPAAVKDSAVLTWQVTSDTVTGLAHLASGRDTNQVSSSVGIVRVSAQAWRSGLRDFLFVLGLISLALGLLNLLPVLPLDGGHIVMAIVEKVRGRTFTQAVYVRYSVVGLTLFAVLMYFGLRNDLFGGGG